MQKINIELKERGYDILIGSGLLNEVSDMLRDFISGKKCFIITDDNVNRIYGDKILKSLESVCSSVVIADFPAGEGSKNLLTVENLYHKASSAGLDRSSVIVALGGGVTGDIAGFVAATYMRGIDFIQIPTTLLAMVDSSVGGKTGIDLPEGKNLVGAFWQPRLVLIDPAALLTLPEREIRCGLAEIVKYGIILDAAFFNLLELNTDKLLSLDMDFYAAIIGRCCELKAQVVTADERESNLRAILNYGHTFAHAIETVTGYKRLAHGEAVAIGMRMAAKFAVVTGRLKEESASRQEKLLRNLGLPCGIKVNPHMILDAMSKDKKVLKGGLRLVLPDSIGKVSVIGNVDKKTVLEAIKSCCE